MKLKLILVIILLLILFVVIVGVSVYFATRNEATVEDVQASEAHEMPKPSNIYDGKGAHGSGD